MQKYVSPVPYRCYAVTVRDALESPPPSIAEQTRVLCGYGHVFAHAPLERTHTVHLSDAGLARLRANAPRWIACIEPARAASPPPLPSARADTSAPLSESECTLLETLLTRHAAQHWRQVGAASDRVLLAHLLALHAYA